MKQNIEFYPHYATSDQHAKFKMLRVEFGWAGEGKFWALNNRIAQADGCCLDVSKKYNKAALASDLDFSMAEFDKFILFLKDDCELISECEKGIITTDIVIETFDKVMKDRGEARARYRRASGEKEKTSGEKTYRVKESKGKESKEKKYKRKIPDVFPLTNELKKYALEKGIFKNEIDSIFEHFKNHHGAKGTLMLDWNKCWYTWIRNEIKFNAEKYAERREFNQETIEELCS